MPKTRQIVKVSEESGKVITKTSLGELREFEIVGRTEKGLYLCKGEGGWYECFSEFDLGKVKNKFKRELNLESGRAYQWSKYR